MDALARDVFSFLGFPVTTGAKPIWCSGHRNRILGSFNLHSSDRIFAVVPLRRQHIVYGLQVKITYFLQCSPFVVMLCAHSSTHLLLGTVYHGVFGSLSRGGGY